MAAAPPLAPCLRSVRAVVLDTDGVITDSARRHAAAWKQAFDACLSTAGGRRPFDDVDDCLRHVDGRSRSDGAAALLRSRGLDLPEGRPDDCAAVSTSRHAAELLARAGLDDRFHTVADGNEARRLRLPGKPDPALFVEAARRLRVPVGDTAVVEDALAGVEAGRRGGFGLVVGVNRTGDQVHAAGLRRHGADVVVSDPGDLLTAGGSG